MTTCRHCFAEIEFNEVDGWVHVFSHQQQCSDGSPERAEPEELDR